MYENLIPLHNITSPIVYQTNECVVRQVNATILANNTFLFIGLMVLLLLRTLAVFSLFYAHHKGVFNEMQVLLHYQTMLRVDFFLLIISGLFFVRIMFF